MPAYNAERYIEQAVDSILNQTYSNIELLICDDGSHDRTPDIIRSYRDPRIKKFYNRENIGNLKTSNFLFAKCTGDFIGIQDADDWSSPYRVEMAMNCFAKNELLGIVGTNYILTDQDGNELSCGVIPTENEEIKKRMEREVPPLLCASVIVKKSVSDKVGYYRLFFDRKGFADFDWIYRVCEITSAKNIIHPCYYYRKHFSSFSHTHEGRNCYSQYEMHQVLVEAHRQRLNGITDFIEYPNHSSIRSFISNLRKQQGDRAIWSHQESLAIEYYLSSLKLNPFDLYAIKSLLRLTILNKSLIH